MSDTVRPLGPSLAWLELAPARLGSSSLLMPRGSYLSPPVAQSEVSASNVFSLASSSMLIFTGIFSGLGTRATVLSHDPVHCACVVILLPIIII